MASSSPPPSGEHADVDENSAVAARAGESGREGRGGRLRPAPPPVAHAPLLLGIDPGGGEHPQGPEHADEESLTARVWGCVCGWRGTLRDVSTRPFHPRVGDGGRLRRQRLTRSDRDARVELETHLTHAIRPVRPIEVGDPIPVASDTPPASSNTPLTAAGRGRPRGLRRRLTSPPTGSEDASPTPSSLSALAPWEHRPSHAVDAASGAVAHERDPTNPWPEDPQPSAAREGAPPRPVDARDAALSVSNEALEAAAARVRVAREELDAAEAALSAVVTQSRGQGLSWRAIGRAAGVAHREAAARWGEVQAGH